MVILQQHWRLHSRMLSALRVGDIELVEALCSRYCSTSLGDIDGLSPLHLAAVYGFKDVAGILLNHRAIINEGTRGLGDTPLHVAARNYQGDLQSVQVLLNAGADLHCQDDAGNTPLLLHSSSAWLCSVITRILCPDADTASRANAAGSVPVLEVVKSTCPSRQEALTVLVRAGCQLDVANSLGSTPLHLACCNSDWSSALILVRSGARADLADSLGRSSLFIALQNDNLILAEAMIAAGNSCQLPEEQLTQLTSTARACTSKKRINSLKFTARRTLRRLWGRCTDSELDKVFIPTQLKHYVYYLLE